MERLIVILLDAKEFNDVEGKVFHCTNYHSFNMIGVVENTWSNGWCPVSQFKLDDNDKGIIYGRIANELIPEGVYSGSIVSTSDSTLRNKYVKAVAN
jgi:hypothetical protein